MNTVNSSTGFSPFQLRFGHRPSILPPLFPPPTDPAPEDITARSIIDSIQDHVAEARDNLTIAKISQSFHANKKRSADAVYNIGDRVMLSTLNRRRQYKSAGEHRVAKFMPHFDDHTSSLTFTHPPPRSPWIFPMHLTFSPPFTQHTSNLSKKTMTSNTLPAHSQNPDPY